MSLLKLITTEKLIDTEKLMELISTILPDTFEQKYFENLVIQELTDISLTALMSDDDWGLDENLPTYTVKFAITKKGELKYISHVS